MKKLVVAGLMLACAFSATNVGAQEKEGEKEEGGREEEQEPKQYNQNRRKGHDDIGDRELDCVWFMTGTLLTCVRVRELGCGSLVT